MPAPLSERQRLEVLRALFEGCSYEEAARIAGVSKSAVGNVWHDFLEGRIPTLSDLREQAQALRDLAVELRRQGTNVVEVLLGLCSLRYLHSLGIEPPQVSEWAAMCRRLAGDEAAASEALAATLALHRLEQETGLDARALEERVRGLEEKRQSLEAETATLESLAGEVERLQRQKDGLSQEAATLKKQRDNLREDIAKQERRVAGLSCRAQNLEQACGKLQEEHAVLESAVQTLRKEKAALGAALAEEQSNVRREIRAIATIARDSAADLSRKLEHNVEQTMAEVQRITSQALEEDSN